ncbi:MAG: hypothetical protein ACKOYJ_05460, partial [Planctomycetia bacterium]
PRLDHWAWQPIVKPAVPEAVSEFAVRPDADKPYARFIEEQVAGDRLPPDTLDGQEAIGFIAAGPWDFIGHTELPETKTDGKIALEKRKNELEAAVAKKAGPRLAEIDSAIQAATKPQANPTDAFGYHSGISSTADAVKWLTPAAFVARLDDTASGVVPAASRGVSPVGATPLPPTHHADCSPTLS